MKLYRCHTCRVKLVNDNQVSNHPGHQWRTPGNISWYEYPKIWLWEAQEWLRK